MHEGDVGDGRASGDLSPAAGNTGQRSREKTKQPGKESKKLEAIGECCRDEESTSPEERAECHGQAHLDPLDARMAPVETEELTEGIFMVTPPPPPPEESQQEEGERCLGKKGD
jgi:hypothetical protein